MQSESKSSGEEKPDSPIQADPTTEAQRLVTLAQERGVVLRALGGVAVGLRCPDASQPPLKRTYGDIDFMASKKQSKAIRELFEHAGYLADRHFNALHGDQRLLFLDEAYNRHIDVFLNVFKMCHTLTLESRLSLHPVTISPADLLLTKLQIVQLNAKDIQDLLALLLDFNPEMNPTQAGEALDLSLITQICANDWGWYTTVHDNLSRLQDETVLLLSSEEATIVQERITRYKKALEQAPKSLGWRMRSRIGRRVIWYELPEEVER